MNKKQIEVCLAKYNESVNTPTFLKNITMIFLDHDARLFPDSKNILFKFDHENEILKFSYGKLNGNKFEAYNDIDTNPNGQIPYSAIGGFIQTSKILYNGQIMYR